MNINQLKVGTTKDESFKGKLISKYWDIRDRISYSDIGCWYSRHIENTILYPFRAWLNPRHKKLRKSIPNRWIDSTELVVIINFAVITEFYEDEFTNGTVLWDGAADHIEFSDWLTDAYNYIKVERLTLDKKLSESYPELQSYVDDNEYWHSSKDNIPYEVLYKDVIYYEKFIRECDDKILTGLIKYRDFMWT